MNSHEEKTGRVPLEKREKPPCLLYFSMPNSSKNIVCIAAVVPRKRCRANIKSLLLKLVPDVVNSPLAQIVSPETVRVTPANSFWALLINSR